MASGDHAGAHTRRRTMPMKSTLGLVLTLLSRSHAACYGANVSIFTWCQTGSQTGVAAYIAAGYSCMGEMCAVDHCVGTCEFCAVSYSHAVVDTASGQCCDAVQSGRCQGPKPAAVNDPPYGFPDHHPAVIFEGMVPYKHGPKTWSPETPDGNYGWTLLPGPQDAAGLCSPTPPVFDASRVLPIPFRSSGAGPLDGCYLSCNLTEVEETGDDPCKVGSVDSPTAGPGAMRCFSGGETWLKPPHTGMCGFNCTLRHASDLQSYCKNNSFGSDCVVACHSPGFIPSGQILKSSAVGNFPSLASSAVGSFPSTVPSFNQLPLLVSPGATNIMLTRASIEKRFAEFMAAFGRNYSSAAMRLERLGVFEANLAKIVQLNARDPGAVYSHLTPWADLREGEFATMHGLHTSEKGQCQFAEGEEGPTLTPTVAPPESLDWVARGATSPVKDQGKCASCWAHASTAVVESRLQIDTGKITSLSEQYLLDCDSARVCKGCCGGLPERVLQWLADPGVPGIASEASYPYTSAGGEDPTKGKCNHAVSPVAKVNGFGVVRGQDDATFLAASAQYGVLSTTMDATAIQFYQSGVITTPDCPGGATNHAVAIVGYGTENGFAYWKVRNSYGTAFGESGYFRIARKAAHQDCGMGICLIAATGANYTK